MTEYRVTFWGRTKGYPNSYAPQSIVVVAESPREARKVACRGYYDVNGTHIAVVSDAPAVVRDPGEDAADRWSEASR